MPEAEFENPDQPGERVESDELTEASPVVEHVPVPDEVLIAAVDLAGVGADSVSFGDLEQCRPSQILETRCASLG